MSGDRVTILEPNGVQRTKPLTFRGLNIGRGDENDLVIGYTAVSRNHALVTYNQGRYYVTDLNTGNGTYLGEDRLVPNTPTLWAPGRALRIGDVLMHLEHTGDADPKAETFAGLLPAGDQEGGEHDTRGALKWLLGAVVLAVLLVVVIIVLYEIL
jgi:predicted component of type VI protein secretion system